MTPREKLHAAIDQLSEADAAAARVVVQQKHDSAAIGRAIAEGYRRIPQDTPDKWGDITKFGKTAIVYVERPPSDEHAD